MPHFDLDSASPAGRGLARLHALGPTLPFPVREHVARLAVMMEEQQPAGAVWHLKDSVEAVARLCFVATTAELLRLDTVRGSWWLEEPEDCPEPLRELARFVRYNPYPSLGALVARLRDLVVPNRALGGTAGPTALLAEVWPGRGGVGGALEELRDWRNGYHGHGALGDSERAVREVVHQLPRLAHLLEALVRFFAAARLGCEPLLEGEEWPRDEAPELAPSGARGISLRPLLELLALPGSLRPRLGALEGGDARRPRLNFRTLVDGQERRLSRSAVESPELAAVEALAERRELPPAGEEHIEAIPIGRLLHLEEARFADFSSALYTEPTYLVDEIERVVESARAGALRLVGPAGCGKSFLVRGLVARWRRVRPWLVLPFYAQPGKGAEPAALVDRLSTECTESVDDLKSHGLFLNKPERPPRVEALGEWLGQLLRFNPGVERLVVVLDGLDEIRPREDQADLTAILPRELPDGLVLLLSGRDDDELDPAVRRHLRELPAAAGSPVAMRPGEAGPRGEANRALLLRYLSKHWHIESKARREALLAGAGERFLHVAMLAQGVAAGLFDEHAAPPPERLAVAFVEGLARRMAMLPAYARALEQAVAFLAAAPMAVPRECLVDWGIDTRFVDEILLDLRGLLLREPAHELDFVRGRAERHRYRIYHREVVETLRTDPEWGPRVTEAQARLAERLQEERAGLWGDPAAVDSERPEDAYALLALSTHAALSGVQVTPADLEAVAWRLLGLAHECAESRPLAALEAIASARQAVALAGEDLPHETAERLSGVAFCKAAGASWAAGDTKRALSNGKSAVKVLSALLMGSGGSSDILTDLFRALMIAGRVMLETGCRTEALPHFEQAETIARQLLERLGRSPQALRHLERSLIATGAILLEDGRRSEALPRFEKAEALARELVDQLGRLPGPLRDLAVSVRASGQVLLSEGRSTEALARYEEATIICRELVHLLGRGPGELGALSFSLGELGNLLLSQGRREESLAMLKEAVAIDREQVERLGQLPVPLGELSVSLLRVAKALLLEGRSNEAIARIDEAAVIIRDLIARVGPLPEVLRRLSVSHSMIGAALLSTGTRDQALSRFQEALAIDREVVERFGRQPDSLRNLAISLMAVGDFSLAEDRPSDALSHFFEAEAIHRELLAGRGSSLETLRDLASSLQRVGSALLAERRRIEALVRFTEVVAIERELEQRSRGPN